MHAGRTARERARIELTGEIKAAARRQLAEEGAARLSLRAVARELGMVSSAVYRYFPSRDELLTALIVDAYDALGEAAEQAVAAAAGAPLLERWRAASRAIRAWAIAHPHEYALVYGSPVPGYRAPTATVQPAARAVLVLVTLLREAWDAGAVVAPDEAPELPPATAAEMARLAAGVAPGIDAAATFRMLLAWTQLLGMVSFELFGHAAGVVEQGEVAFCSAVDAMAAYVGLRADGPGYLGRDPPPAGRLGPPGL